MQPRQRQTNANNNISMTSCHKGGIKIRDTGNNKVIDPFAGVNPFNVHTEEKSVAVTYDKFSYEKLDLNIDSYSREELYKLFGLKNMVLSEEIMKECKKTVLKTHPDKSRLDEKYFIFFGKAYKKLLGIYEFQNKIQIKKTTDTNEYFDSDNANILNNVFEQKKDLKDPKKFNSWFNEQFDKHKLEDPNETGYGGWLKSDEDIVYTPNVTKANMASEMEKRKKQVQTMTTYNGVSDPYASTFGGSSLMAYDSNFSSGSLFSSDGMGYTDLRQAYVESVIPVTEDDFRKTQQFKSVDEYKRHRESVDTKPLSKEEAMRQLFNENKQKDEESAALAFYYAQQSEKAKVNQNNFWSGLKQVTNW
jgi:curved DNA-binding protein CbpA